MSNMILLNEVIDRVLQ